MQVREALRNAGHERGSPGAFRTAGDDSTAAHGALIPVEVFTYRKADSLESAFRIFGWNMLCLFNPQ